MMLLAYERERLLIKEENREEVRVILEYLGSFDVLAPEDVQERRRLRFRVREMGEDRIFGRLLGDGDEPSPREGGVP